MTPKEAIDWCEQFTENLIWTDVDAKKRTLGLQAMQECKSALEKQIPKKPIGDGWGGYLKCCPNCESKAIYDHKALKPRKRCDNCGQKLDWSDTE